MLSFEISVIDVVLVLAIIVLLILYITKLSTKSVAEPEEKGAEKPSKAVGTQKSIEERRLQTRPQTRSLECPYHFGYLKKLPEHAPIPDECFRCPRMSECFCK